MKSPKLYSLDTGLARSIRAADDWQTLERQNGAGAMVETWVAAELLKLLPLVDRRPRLYFWRTGKGEEVDFLIERGGFLIGVEVKWGARITGRDVALSPRIIAMPFDVFFGIAHSW